MRNFGKYIIVLGFILIGISLGFTIKYRIDDINSKKMADDAMELIARNIDSAKDSVIRIDDVEYIGYLRIESLNLNLPITNGYSYHSLKRTPGLYYGNVYKNMVICGHSYKYHFGNLYKLKQGDVITFTDVYNNKFVYEVELIEILAPTDIKEMIESDFDLTLYTCTKDSKNRVVVRCNKRGNIQNA